MEIHLVSSLNADDESRLAPRLLAAIGSVLDGLPVSYSVRIETALGDAIHHSHNAVHPRNGDSQHDACAAEEGGRTAHA
jgi:hypothetical protein